MYGLSASFTLSDLVFEGQILAQFRYSLVYKLTKSVSEVCLFCPNTSFLFVLEFDYGYIIGFRLKQLRGYYTTSMSTMLSSIPLKNVEHKFQRLIFHRSNVTRENGASPDVDGTPRWLNTLPLRHHRPIMATFPLTRHRCIVQAIFLHFYIIFHTWKQTHVYSFLRWMKDR